METVAQLNAENISGLIRFIRGEKVILDNESIVSRSQFVTLKRGQNIKYCPFAFTEQGVAMLSSVLNSDRAIQVNIAIMRAFVKMRKFLETHKELALKIEELERTVSSHDENIQLIFETIRQLIVKKREPMEPVGFKISGRNSKS